MSRETCLTIIVVLIIGLSDEKPTEKAIGSRDVVNLVENFGNGVGSSFVINDNIASFGGYWNWEYESAVEPVREGVLVARSRTGPDVHSAHLHSVESFTFTDLYATFEVEAWHAEASTTTLHATFVDSTGNDHAEAFEEEISIPIKGEWQRTKEKVITENLDPKFSRVCLQARGLGSIDEIFIDKLTIYDSSLIPTPTSLLPTTSTTPRPSEDCDLITIGTNLWIWTTPAWPSFYNTTLCSQTLTGTAVVNFQFIVPSDCLIPDPTSPTCSNSYLEIPGYEKLCGDSIANVYTVDGSEVTFTFKGDARYPGKCSVNIRGYYDRNEVP